MTNERIDVLEVTEYLVTYRDTYNTPRTFTVAAVDQESATAAAHEWKGSAPVSIVSVREVPEFQNGEFPPQANVGPLA
jgi:hypothetical protein